ncbi:hypothetical protein G8O24_43505, partial [Bradyrhizobium sp. INPA01-394B]|nr:hypothetical protein [Bradyrhizobium campsiandrae]
HQPHRLALRLAGGDDAVADKPGLERPLEHRLHRRRERGCIAGVGLTSDTAVPVSSVPAFIDQATAAVRAIVPDLAFIIVGHM